jgi:hypothetical protein
MRIAGLAAFFLDIQQSSERILVWMKQLQSPFCVLA